MNRRDGSLTATVPRGDVLGICSRCGEELRRIHLLIEYETSRGPDAFAECPGCDHVVHPR